MSIVYFPKIYPDELVFSCLARYCEHEGYPVYICCAEDIYTNKRIRPDIEFLNELKDDVIQHMCKDITIEQLIMEHTMFPYYARFLPSERRAQAFKGLCDMRGDYHNLMVIPLSKNKGQRKLRYCPVCVTKDRMIYGETYWHREHQMMGVDCCPVHGCSLKDTTILIKGNVSPHLTSAECELGKINWGENEEDLSYANVIDKELAGYIAEVLKTPVNMKNETDVGKFLHTRLYGTKYVSVRGGQRNIAELTEDFLNHYSNLSNKGLTKLWQIQKVFNGKRINTYEICQLAMFLDIKASELCNMKLPEYTQEEQFDKRVKQLHNQGIGYNKIAKMLGVSSKTIREAESQKSAKKKKINHNAGGVKARDWNRIDKESLPLVKNVIKNIYGMGDNRPLKVTEYAVCRALSFPDKRLQYLPECRKEVMKYKETWEQYWSREIVWAVHTLHREGRQINWKSLREITNMRKENLIRSIPCLKEMNPDVAELVEQLI